MAGIYLHIPFCKQACHYCDFHFSTNTGISKELVRAMGEEILLQRDYLQGETLQTIYFGGGTPSLLDAGEIAYLLGCIHKNHTVDAGAEITLEANPDDLSDEKLSGLRAAQVNRLSIGIQSFDDNMLRFLNRVHTGETAVSALDRAQAAGFHNISIDLIYAIPGLTLENWKSNIEAALRLKPQHISAYTLTIEERTAFGNWLSKGKLSAVEESVAAEQMELLVAVLAASGYRQYEISNFCLPGFESRHNSAYWRGDKYLGVGPGAHSYNKATRQHNVANNHLYVRALGEGKIPAESETLKRDDQINEYILTTLRTDVGCDLAVLKNTFGYDVLVVHGGYLQQLQNHDLVSLQDHHLRLTKSGRLLADKISSDLFLVG
jgi:oxygen-independent coproporphyrinogen-3 oxidase